MTDSVTPEAPAASTPPPSRTHWSLRVLLWTFVMGLGAVYGVLGYQFFATLFSDSAHGRSGLMTVAFLAMLPLCIGALAVLLIQRQRRVGFWQAIGMSSVPLLLFLFLAGTLLREGFICILMALPLVLVLGFVGAAIGWMASALSKGTSTRMMSVVVLMPFAFGAVEQELPLQDQVQTVTRSIDIQAPAEVVWRHINMPTGIQPGELKDGVAYRIGVPYPIEGRTLEPRVGGMRHLVWQRGVAFDEEITVWEPQRQVAWKYVFGPGSFPQGSLDDHIVIGGRYFNLEDTSYTLTPQTGGTRLTVNVSFRVSTHFNWYAGAWARFLVSDTAETILGFYKHRAEAG